MKKVIISGLMIFSGCGAGVNNSYHFRCEIPNVKVLIDCNGTYQTHDGHHYASCDNERMVEVGDFVSCYHVPVESKGK